MSVLLYVLAALAVMAGTAMIAIGIPIKEFGIGNTLMLAGTFALCSGLVVLGLAMVLAQLSRLVEVLSIRPVLRDTRMAGPFERPEMSPVALPADAARIPFPPKPKLHGDKPQADRTQSELRDFPPPAAMEPASDAPAVASPAPSLRNPVLTPMPEAAVRDTVAAPQSPSRPAESPAAAPAGAESAAPPLPPFPPPDAGRQPSPPPVWPPQPSYFDAMWPPENRPVKKGNGDAARTPARFEPPPAAMDSTPAEPATPPSASAGEAQASIILKSGIVDGMAYTLYVDGSIEAELPHGTLRFASINELRAHLEKGT